MAMLASQAGRGVSEKAWGTGAKVTQRHPHLSLRAPHTPPNDLISTGGEVELTHANHFDFIARYAKVLFGIQ